MSHRTAAGVSPAPKTLVSDLLSGSIVFLVALPLCLGIAIASDADPIAGLISGIVGGIVVGLLSGSHTSVSGPAAGLTAIVAAQIASLGGYTTFLLAVVFAGFSKAISEVLAYPDGVQWGAITIGLATIIFLLAWDRVKFLKNSLIPAPLLVVVLGVALVAVFNRIGGQWGLDVTQLVDVPIAKSVDELKSFMSFPDFSQLGNSAVYMAAIPLTSVVIRGSVNVNAGAQSKLSAVFHGILLLVCTALIPHVLKMIPLSCLAGVSQAVQATIGIRFGPSN